MSTQTADRTVAVADLRRGDTIEVPVHDATGAVRTEVRTVVSAGRSNVIRGGWYVCFADGTGRGFGADTTFRRAQ